MKKNIDELNAKRAALRKLLRETEIDIQNAGGNTYVIEYETSTFGDCPAKKTIRHALDEEDAIRKWRADYHRWDCQGCTGDYPIYDVYLKGHKTPKGEKTYADRQKEKFDKCFMNQINALRKKYKLG